MTNEEMRLKLFEVAKLEIGVKEFTNGSNPRIEEYHKAASVLNDKSMTDDVSWCSAFACFIVETCGLKSTNNRAARSWLKWGVETQTPKRGDIVIFWRGSIDGWQGHVAFFDRFDENGNVRCLGGNQKDEVCVSTYLSNRVIGYRTNQLP
jgi:uncharacterized protein (TIGR02594 family)